MNRLISDKHGPMLEIWRGELKKRNRLQVFRNIDSMAAVWRNWH